MSDNSDSGDLSDVAGLTSDSNSFVFSFVIGTLVLVFCWISFAVLQKIFPRVYKYRQRLHSYEDQVNVNGERIWYPPHSSYKSNPNRASFQSELQESSREMLGRDMSSRNLMRRTRYYSRYAFMKMFKLVSWIFDAYQIEESTIARHISVDAVMYLRFNKTLTWMFFWLSLLSMVTLFPAYATGDKKNLAPVDPSRTTGHMTFSMANLESGDPLLWVTLLFEGLSTIVICWILARDYEAYAFYSRKFRATHSPANYGILVQDIPPDFRSSKMIYDFFDRLVPGQVVYACYIQHAPKLVKRIEEFGKVVEKKEVMIFKTVKRRNHRAPMVRRVKPNIRSPMARVEEEKNEEKVEDERGDLEDETEQLATDDDGGSKNCFGKFKPPKITKNVQLKVPIEYEQVEASKYYYEKQGEIWCKVHAAQRHPKYIVPTNSAIVIFESLYIASCVVQSQIYYRAGQFTISRCPEPEDVNYPKLKMSENTNSAIKGFIYMGILLVVVFWSAVAVFISALSNLTALAATPTFSWLQPVLNALPSWLINLIENFLPPLLLNWISGLVPDLFFFLLNLGRNHAISVVEVKVRNSMYLFYFVTNFLTILISGSLLAELQRILEDASSLLTILSETIPAQATFFINQLIQSGLIELSFVLLQAERLVKRLLKLLVNKRKTERILRRIDAGACSDFDFFDWYSQLLYASLVSLVYSSISPLVNPIALGYFLYAFFVNKYNICYTHYKEYQSGGALHDGSYKLLLLNVLIKHVSMIIIFSFFKAPIQAALEIIVLAVCLLLGVLIRKRYVDIARNGCLAEVYDVYEKRYEKGMRLKTETEKSGVAAEGKMPDFQPSPSPLSPQSSLNNSLPKAPDLSSYEVLLGSSVRTITIKEPAKEELDPKPSTSERNPASDFKRSQRSAKTQHSSQYGASRSISMVHDNIATLPLHYLTIYKVPGLTPLEQPENLTGLTEGEIAAVDSNLLVYLHPTAGSDLENQLSVNGSGSSENHSVQVS